MSNRIRLTRIASITSELDRIADEVQNYDPEIALAIDKVSDQMENRYIPMGQKDFFDPEKLKNGTYTGDLRINKGMVENGKMKLPRIKEVTGDFGCTKLNLTSLEGAPETVGGHFICFENNLTTLRGAPKKVGGDFFCTSNKLTSLEGAPEEVGRDFRCSFNKLTSLEGAPEKVGGDFECNPNEGKGFTEKDVREVSKVRGRLR